MTRTETIPPAILAGTSQRQRYQFAAMSPADQRAAVRRLSFYGRSDHAIAELVGWHVTEVQRAIAEHEPLAEPAP